MVLSERTLSIDLLDANWGPLEANWQQGYSFHIFCYIDGFYLNLRMALHWAATG